MCVSKNHRCTYLCYYRVQYSFLTCFVILADLQLRVQPTHALPHGKESHSATPSAHTPTPRLAPAERDSYSACVIQRREGIMADLKESLQQLTFPPGPWIEETRISLGKGHYGTVLEVKIRGLQCAGKKYDVSLFAESTEEGSATAKRFVEQCLQLGQVRHPNVVQLLGVFFDSKSAPTLVSELLPLNLSKCLEEYQHIPSYAKSSILLDVTTGLRYLHEQKQPIVHGRLSAEKILLTVSLQAKICGLINPAGTSLPDSSYSPPEVSAGTAATSAGDVFSLGNLVLHVISQKYPTPTEKEVPNPESPEQTITRSEAQRREQSLKELGETHPLSSLVKQCLEDDPSSRPRMSDVSREMEQYVISTPPPYASILQVMQEVEQVALLKDNITALTQTLEAKQAELDAKELEVEGVTQELAVKTKEVDACKEEVEAYKQTVQSKDRKMQMHDQALRAKDALIKAKAREIVAKNQQISAKDSLLGAANRRIEALEQQLMPGKKPSFGLRFPSTPVRSPIPTARSQQSSPTFKESPYKQLQSAEAEDLAAGGGEVLRRKVRGRRGKPTPMSDGIFYQSWGTDAQKSGHQRVDPKLASILARQHKKYEEEGSSEATKELESGQQTKASETAAHSTSDQSPLRRQRSQSGSPSTDMSPELQKLMEKRRSQVDLQPEPPSTGSNQ